MGRYKALDGLYFHDSYMVEQLAHVYPKISQDPINVKHGNSLVSSPGEVIPTRKTIRPVKLKIRR